MNEFIEYQKFSDKLDAKDLIFLLKKHEILHEIEEPALQFRLVDNSMDDYVIIKIQNIDIAKVDKLCQAKDDEEFEKNTDHYLYTFSNEDIIDVVVNQSNWTNLEVRIANKIATERDLKPTADLVKSLQKDKKTSDQQNGKTGQQKSIQIGASWFLWVGILSIINLVAYLLNQDIPLITGLNINSVFIGIALGINDATKLDLMLISVILSIIISCLFIWFGLKSKKHNKKVYLIGLLIYGLDGLLSLFFKDWYSLSFHLLALIFMFTGYKSLISSLKEINQ